jgi:CheY-like chemotaxis protein
MTKTRTLMIVDDNARMRATIRSILSPLRADTVVECGNGLDAIAKFEEVRPDCVLMDLSMPGLDGIAATKRIREIDPDAQVVIVTDFSDAAFRRAAADAGASDYVTKDNLFKLLDILQ